MLTKKLRAGDRVGHLLVVAPGITTQGRRRGAWECACDCGATITVRDDALRSGSWNSCGCQKRTAIGKRSTIHGGTRTPEFKVWSGMLDRCNNPRVPVFHRYGGRGISVCERWLSFANFIEDMGPRPSAEHSLDRIDNDGNYEPENCRWATIEAQQNNKSTNVLLECDGITMTLSEWASNRGIRYETIRSRIRAGWPTRVVLGFARRRAKGKSAVPAEVRRHWDRVAAIGCLCCQQPAEIAHAHGGSMKDLGIHKAKGMKTSDWLALPLCPRHHRQEDGLDNAVLSWEKEFGTQVEHLDEVCRRLGYNVWRRGGIDRDVPGVERE